MDELGPIHDALLVSGSSGIAVAPGRSPVPSA